MPAPDGRSVAYIETPRAHPDAPVDAVVVSADAGREIRRIADVAPVRPAWDARGRLLLMTGATVLVLDTVNERATLATMDQLRTDSLAGLRYVKNISDAYGLDVVDTTFRVRNNLMGWEQGAEVLDRATERIQNDWDKLLQTHLTEVQQTLVDDIRRQRESAVRAAAKLRAILQSQNLDELGRFADTDLYPAIDPVTTVRIRGTFR